MPTPHGGELGERFIPFDRIGAYIPGGAAPLASTALMTLTLAKVAGVKQLIACSPADKDGTLNPYIIYALCLAGADEIYKIGVFMRLVPWRMARRRLVVFVKL